MRSTSSSILFLLILLSCDKASKIQQKSKVGGDEVSKQNIKTNQEYSLYKGAWFDIKYPANFTVKPSMKSLTSQDGYDTVFFISPDGKVEFYIFSPQWNGEAKDISLKSNEKMAEDFKEKHIRRWTIVDKDSHYSRSYVEFQNTQENTKRIFGLKYASTEDLKRYEKEYSVFKNSLIQFGD